MTVGDGCTSRRCRRDVDQHGSEATEPYQPGRHPSDPIPISSMSRRWPRAWPATGARDLPHEGRRQDVGNTCSSSTKTLARHRSSWIPTTAHLFAGMWEIVYTPGCAKAVAQAADFLSRDRRRQPGRSLQGNGLPRLPVGKVELCMTPADSRRIYALLETGDGVPWKGSADGKR